MKNVKVFLKKIIDFYLTDFYQAVISFGHSFRKILNIKKLLQLPSKLQRRLRAKPRSLTPRSPIRYLVVVGCFALSAGLMACSIDASITQIVKDSIGVSDLHRTEPDVAAGEEVTVAVGSSNYKIKAVVGEVTETATTNNSNYQMEGVFNE